MNLDSVLRSIFPSWIFDYFDGVKLEDSEERMDVYFDEKKIPPSDLDDRPVVAYGFTNSYVVQDFPIRGKEVYLHFRRRKWQVQDTKDIISRNYDIAYEGTKLTNEFVAFLKETNRD